MRQRAVLMAVFPRKSFTLALGARSLELGRRTLIMGILNVTPDSFSDAGECYGYSKALQRASGMIEAGADLIDVGGESTRPSAEPVPVDLELARVIPVISEIRKLSSIPISIDTTKAEVANHALAAGADIINDVSALRFDGQMADVAARSGAPLILMHMQGTPATMQQDPTYTSLFSEIVAFLEERIAFASGRGIDRRQIIIDPGIGFGKDLDHNLRIIRNLEIFQSLERPILLGASRKRFIGAVLDRPVSDREVGTAVAHSFGIAAGAHIIRCHDVAYHKQVALMSDAIRDVV